MSATPPFVICRACRKSVRVERARRRITLWARLGRGGSLSGIKDQHAEDVYRCDECIAAGRFEAHGDEQTTLAV